MPAQLGLGVGLVFLHILQKLSQIRLVAFCQAGGNTCLLHNNKIPIFILKTLQQCKTGLRGPAAHIVLIVNIFRGIGPGIEMMHLQAAAAYIEIPQPHRLHTVCFGNIIKPGHGIYGIAVADGQYL